MSDFLTISAQVAAMKRDWPMFKARKIDRARHAARWVGTVKPHLSSYELELRFAEGWPEVRVLSPALKQLPGNPEGRLPHIYGPVDNPTLCLFDPQINEWQPSMLLSRTIVPWSLDWLACYDLWLMTGEWTGGGRHPTPMRPTAIEGFSS